MVQLFYPVLLQHVKQVAGGGAVPTCASARAVMEAVTQSLASVAVRRATQDHAANRVGGSHNQCRRF